MLATTALLSLLFLDPGPGAGPLAPTVPTSTTLEVVDVTASSRLLVHVDVLQGSVLAEGIATIRDGDRVVASVPVHRGRAELAVNTVWDGEHVLTAEFGMYGHFGGSRSGQCLTGKASAPARGNATVTIPVGALTITTATHDVAPTGDPAPDRRAGSPSDVTVSGPAQVVVTDTRAGNLGFTVQVVVDNGGEGDGVRSRDDTSAVSICEVRGVRLPGNALDPADARLPGGCVAPARSATLASYPAGRGLGALDLRTRVVVPVAATGARLVWTVL